MGMPIAQRFVFTLKLRQTNFSVVQQCAIFTRLLNMLGYSDPKVVRGYATCMGTACQHYWVTDGVGNTYDIGKMYAQLYTPEIANVDTVLTLEYTGKIEENDVSKKNEEDWVMYTEDPKAFWRRTKFDYKSLRVVTH